MTLSRHARNEMRLYGIDAADLRATVAKPISRQLDERGNTRLGGRTGDGRPILVVVAGDDPGFVITVSFGVDVRADYDSSANAISITDGTSADRSDEVHPRAIVALADGQPVEMQLLYPDMGLGEPLAAVAERYDLDREALGAAAQSALAAPDRVVSLEVAARPAA
jgi:Domain of unknown function (DUF4258)